MGKVITIRVPDWVSEDFVRRVERLVEEEIERAFASGRVDRETYLRFIETYSTTDDVLLENDEEMLSEMRKKEKARINGSY
ncbi:hypothetical protein TK1996 [Thermococcus kodakarensis KOD1]|uniref:Uncharacterized protein n=1 Tax=Thermococcus kodakarensis (strain ATCC BAA-918 / JCM 12380 / KOD1) TaxID=69014 RepID=Q5JII5_THEKO|nr:hypothetical protein [Thermococcus kodakarensis]WCN27872.1 hypothetical protein POG15_10175 [Thermococcus kodakarensis]WCN30170.1 hypothetical protein POG21_10160 [Thermococcus kodakarensis]BAD86185.1 hypothetical protein TK1996 [Thermococcus kodakarensis KOD1]